MRRVALLLSITTASISLSLLAPIAWYLYDPDDGGRALFASFALGIGISMVLGLVGRKARISEMSTREAIASVPIAWIVASVVASMPYLLSGVLPSPIDAVFEGISGMTTTGATVMADVELVPRSLLMWRSLTQWLGGIGIVVLALMFMTSSGAAMDLFRSEVTGPMHQRITPRIRDTASLLCKSYAALTAAEIAALLAICRLDLFDALTLSFSTIATGGFSPYSNNVGHFASRSVYAVTGVFLLMASMNLTFYRYVFIRRRSDDPIGGSEIKFYMAIFVTFTLFTAISLRSHGIFDGWAESLGEGAYHTISMLSTCGAFISNYDEWPAAVKMMMLVLMFIGGCSISTSGGMTCIRVLVMIKQTMQEFRRMLHRKAYLPVRVGGRTIDDEDTASCFAYVIAYLIVFLAGFAAITATGADLMTAISSTAATLGNVGPGLGLAGPTHSYAAQPASAKMIYMALMLFGRLEIFPMIVLVTKGFRR